MCRSVRWPRHLVELGRSLRGVSTSTCCARRRLPRMAGRLLGGDRRPGRPTTSCTSTATAPGADRVGRRAAGRRHRRRGALRSMLSPVRAGAHGYLALRGPDRARPISRYVDGPSLGRLLCKHCGVGSGAQRVSFCLCRGPATALEAYPEASRGPSRLDLRLRVVGPRGGLMLGVPAWWRCATMSTSSSPLSSSTKSTLHRLPGDDPRRRLSPRGAQHAWLSPSASNRLSPRSPAGLGGAHRLRGRPPSPARRSARPTRAGRGDAWRLRRSRAGISRRPRRRVLRPRRDPARPRPGLRRLTGWWCCGRWRGRARRRLLLFACCSGRNGFPMACPSCFERPSPGAPADEIARWCPPASWGRTRSTARRRRSLSSDVALSRWAQARPRWVWDNVEGAWLVGLASAWTGDE